MLLKRPFNQAQDNLFGQHELPLHVLELFKWKMKKETPINIFWPWLQTLFSMVHYRMRVKWGTCIYLGISLKNHKGQEEWLRKNSQARVQYLNTLRHWGAVPSWGSESLCDCFLFCGNNHTWIIKLLWEVSELLYGKSQGWCLTPVSIWHMPAIFITITTCSHEEFHYESRSLFLF
jgi:hypothetical protein